MIFFEKKSKDNQNSILLKYFNLNETAAQSSLRE